jgi:triosephosphate isomerase
MKKLLIVANWKMNPENFSQAKILFNLVKKRIKNIKNTEVIICPPFVFLSLLKANGAQDCFWEERGAYTGEISPKMLKNLDCQYVIIGHSERRHYLGETDEMINKKLKAALKMGLKPILCIANLSQLKKGLEGIFEKIIIAYEPLSAIGTGKPYDWEKAKKTKDKIQKILSKNIKILYGGSVNSENALSYIKQGGFQGLLIGSASLKAKEFIKIAKAVSTT